MKVIKIRTNSIKLGQFIKYSGLVSTGGEIKIFLVENVVKVNKIPTNSRGKQLFKGDIVEINDEFFMIEVENGN